MPDYEQLAELIWKDGHPAMQDLGSKVNRHHNNHKISTSGYWGNDRPAAINRRQSQGGEKEVDGTLDAIVENLPPIDEETASWFNYALNEFQEPALGHRKPEKPSNSASEPSVPDALVPEANTIARPEYAFAHSISMKSELSVPNSQGATQLTEGTATASIQKDKNHLWNRLKDSCAALDIYSKMPAAPAHPI